MTSSGSLAHLYDDATLRNVRRCVVWRRDQPVVQERSLSGLRTAQMCLIRSPARSNANTVTVTPPSCCATRPGWPLTVRSRMRHVAGHQAGEIDVVPRDLLGAFDRAERGAGEAAAVGDRGGVGVEQADEGVDVLGVPRLLEVPDDAGLLGCRQPRAPATRGCGDGPTRPAGDTPPGSGRRSRRLRRSGSGRRRAG